MHRDLLSSLQTASRKSLASCAVLIARLPLQTAFRNAGSRLDLNDISKSVKNLLSLCKCLKSGKQSKKILTYFAKKLFVWEKLNMPRPVGCHDYKYYTYMSETCIGHSMSIWPRTGELQTCFSHDDSVKVACRWAKWDGMPPCALSRSVPVRPAYKSTHFRWRFLLLLF